MNAKQTAHRAEPGFTLVELLAILVLLLVGSMVLAPGLATTRPNLAATQCLNNLRQLGIAWELYAEENQGRLVPNSAGLASYQPGRAAMTPCWVVEADVMSSTDPTNVALLIDHVRYPYGAYLGPYVRSAAVFKCPADPNLAYPRTSGQLAPRIRSLAMNAYLGWGASSVTSPSKYPLCTNLAQMKWPTRTFVLLDTRADSLVDSPRFVTAPDTAYGLVDYPAAYHNWAGGFLFGDGHAEIHRWRNPQTVAEPLAPTNPSPYRGNADVLWLQERAVGEL